MIIKKVLSKIGLHTPNRLVKEDYHVVGVSYYLDNIHKLACSNPDWKCTCEQLISKGMDNRPVFRYNFVNKPVKLIPEKHPNDKNAVQVVIAGELVGYISRDENVKVRNILAKKDIKFISAFIGGGQYKTVFSDGTTQKFQEDISVSVRIAYV